MVNRWKGRVIEIQKEFEMEIESKIALELGKGKEVDRVQ
jgi:hypothetical protein